MVITDLCLLSPRPSTLLLSTPTFTTSPIRRRFHPPAARPRRVAVLRATASNSVELFGARKEHSATQAFVSILTPPARAGTSLAIAAGVLAAVYKLLRHLGETNGAMIGAGALGAAGAAAIHFLNASVPGAAAVSVHNLVAGARDPTALNKKDVEAIVRRYGVSKDDHVFRAELRDLYCRFIYSVLPLEGGDLKGNESETIIKFKEALGIDDQDAASVHMEIGRHLFRERLETGDPEADAEQHQAFQKLIYVSTLVFGEASKFLLPWKRIFKVTDAQVDIAVRDNAQKLYALKLNSISKDIEDLQLFHLRESQLLYRLSDKIAAEMFTAHTRKLIEENISAALDILKSWTKAKRETTQVVGELEKVLAFNDLLIQLSKHPEAGRFAPGVGPVSLLGGEYDNDRKIDDLKLLYRAYITESFPSGRFEEKMLVALAHLKDIFGLGKHEAETIMLETKSKIYRKRLSQAFSSGDLEEAPSKAAFLQNLCDELHLDPQKASEIHEGIYRQKLQRSVADGELDGDDVASLRHLRVLLCIPQETVDAAHADICGQLFEKVVKDAIASGIEGYDDDVRTSVRKAGQQLQLTNDAAMAIASKAVRNVFMNYIQLSRSTGDSTEAAKELKKMIAFNTLVVTELVYDIRGEPMTVSTEFVNEESKQSDEEDEWDSLQTLRKTRLNTELQENLGKPGQTEINLKDDLPQRDRADLYRSYLLFCLSEEVAVIPFGSQITTKKDNAEFGLLSQLGRILGLDGKEIVEIHRNLAEQAFKKQAEVILADGDLTEARVEQLNEVVKEVGLPAEYAQKLVKNITTAKMAAALETAAANGRITIKMVTELKEANVDFDSMIPESLRECLFKKTVEEIFSSGTGVFDEEEVYEKFPADLSIDVENAKKVVQELAKSKLSNSLVQAVALLRQRRSEGAISSLNDMLACDAAVPAEQPLSWSSPQELSDLYCMYLNCTPDPEKLNRLQYLLGISDSVATMLRDTTELGQLHIEEEEEAFGF